MTASVGVSVASIAPHVVPIDALAPVLDFSRSRGSRFFDRTAGRLIVDFASQFASLPLGYSHPALREPEFERELLEASRIRVANLDMLTDAYAGFLDAFRRVAGAGFERFFFIEGGALGVENALKAAMDWKVNRNLRLGKGERGTEIVHFREAFHGRSGYTLSLTNTADANKTKYFPKFPWARIVNPKVRFPMEGANLEATLEDERAAMAQVEAVMEERADDVAAIIIESHQGEGGDNHFRPEFLRYLREACDRHGALLIFDEVQSGMGMSGRMWAFEHYGVRPDLVAFAKKAQVGGFMAGPRMLEEPLNVFTVPSRISSTWGGALTDMVRCRKYLEVMEAEGLLAHAAAMGRQIVERLGEIAGRVEGIEAVRGLGLLVAFDMARPAARADFINRLYDNGVMALQCGTRSIRFRPHLNVSQDAVDEALDAVEKTLRDMPVEVASATGA